LARALGRAARRRQGTPCMILCDHAPRDHLHG
jgi:hypothetical protein